MQLKEASNADGSSNEEALVLHHLDELKRLLPSAAQEPKPKGIEFPLELFEKLQGWFRIVVSELGTLEWLFAMIAEASLTSSSDLPHQKDVESLLLEMESFFTKELNDIQVMLQDLYARRLQAALGGDATEGTAGSAAAIRQSILDRKEDSLRSASPQSSHFARRLSVLYVAAGSRKQLFQQLVEKMRMAASTVRGRTPLFDRLSQVELLISALHTCSAAISNIQMALAQYG